tara:strand:+ start:772 stop:1152 length:381 start_codon:yes stop_codon:yes gene_type:complete
MQIPPERMSRDALLRRVIELEDDKRRMEFDLDDQLNRIGHTRALLRTTQKVVATKRKRKGQLDAMSKKHIANEAMHTIVQNLLSQPVAILGSMAADEFTIWIPINGVVTAIFGPLTMMVQKLKEEH